MSCPHKALPGSAHHSLTCKVCETSQLVPTTAVVTVNESRAPQQTFLVGSTNYRFGYSYCLMRRMRMERRGVICLACLMVLTFPDAWRFGNVCAQKEQPSETPKDIKQQENFGDECRLARDQGASFGENSQDASACGCSGLSRGSVRW